DRTHGTGRVPVQETVQVEFRTANGDEAREAEVGGVLAELALRVRPELGVAEGRPVVLERREASGRARAVLVELALVGAELGVTLRQECIERAVLYGANVDPGVLRKCRDVRREREVAIP